MVELRPYQRDLLRQTEKALETPNARVMMQLPTGGGKTHIAAALLSGRLKDGRKAAWLTHRRELASQTEGMLRDAGVPATSRIQWIPNASAPTLSNGVVILMAETVSRRNARAIVWSGYDSNDLMVIDEAHHAAAQGWARAIDQWPGPVLGMTATPWRLSEREGFDHLFDELVLGPQVAALQADGWLCQARVVSPPDRDRIPVGRIARTGDFIGSGIEQANEGRDIWTAGALRFWQKHSENRQTVVYAVSVRHARNLADVFNDAQIPAGVLLGDTPDVERADLIGRFNAGRFKVLVNVAVATEGFDLPDAACVVLTRPTMSLSLYLQMVGRGLRPKPDRGDCVILDMAGNSFRHGLPEEDREWSLHPRGISSGGDAPVVWCEKCDGTSHAASHFCKHCNSPLGRDCGRCGKWRAMRRWALADGCAHQHDVVCDLCHLDAHMSANLPASRELRDAAIAPLIFALVDEVWRNLISDNTRERELNELIAQRERENSANSDLEYLFNNYIASLPIEEQPTSNIAIGETVNSWKAQRQEELDRWNEELAELKSKTAIEDKVHRGCYEQLERSENMMFLGGDDLIKDNFLYLKVFEEERERLPDASKSRLHELVQRLLMDGTIKEFGEEYMRLIKPAMDASASRLTTMRRQLDTRWAEIWAEYQQTLK